MAACFNGHWHIDHQREINGIPYIHINSAAYLWVGSRLRKDRLPAELAKRFPTVASTIPYTKPLFTHLTIEGRSVRTGEAQTVVVTYPGGFIDEEQGVWNSEAPSEDDVQLGNRVVAFHRWSENMGGGLAALSACSAPDPAVTPGNPARKAAAASAGGGATTAPASVSMNATTVPTSTVSPSCTTISTRVPAAASSSLTRAASGPWT